MTCRHARHLRTWILAVLAAFLLSLAVPEGFLLAGTQDNKPGKEGESSSQKRSSKKRSKRSSKKGSKKTGKKSSGKKARGPLKLKELPQNDRRDAKFLRDFGEGFKIAHTKHYTIFYNTNEEDVKMFSISIEKIYTQVARYIHKLGIEVKEPKSKLVTHYFETFEQYSIHSAMIGHGPVQEGTLGFYVPVAHDSDRIDPGENMTYFYNIRNTPWFRAAKRSAEATRRQLRERNKGRKYRPGERDNVERMSKASRFTQNRINNIGLEMTESTLQHEITHQVLFNSGFHNYGSAWANPRWLAEGMAQIFETPSDGKSWGVALVNKEKLEAFNGLKKYDRLAPLRSFVSDPRWFFRSDAGSLAYPQSWALLHYISRKYRDELKAYVDLLNARPVDFQTTPEKEMEAFEEAFGPLDEEWEQRWLRWMERLRP